MILYYPNYVKWSTTSQLRQPLVMAGQTHLPAKLNRNELVGFAAESDVINLENQQDRKTGNNIFMRKEMKNGYKVDKQEQINYF